MVNTRDIRNKNTLSTPSEEQVPVSAPQKVGFPDVLSNLPPMAKGVQTDIEQKMQELKDVEAETKAGVTGELGARGILGGGRAQALADLAKTYEKTQKRYEHYGTETTTFYTNQQKITGLQQQLQDNLNAAKAHYASMNDRIWPGDKAQAQSMGDAAQNEANRIKAELDSLISASSGLDVTNPYIGSQVQALPQFAEQLNQAYQQMQQQVGETAQAPDIWGRMEKIAAPTLISTLFPGIGQVLGSITGGAGAAINQAIPGLGQLGTNIMNIPGMGDIGAAFTELGYNPAEALKSLGAGASKNPLLDITKNILTGTSPEQQILDMIQTGQTKRDIEKQKAELIAKGYVPKVGGTATVGGLPYEIPEIPKPKEDYNVVDYQKATDPKYYKSVRLLPPVDPTLAAKYQKVKIPGLSNEGIRYAIPQQKAVDEAAKPTPSQIADRIADAELTQKGVYADITSKIAAGSKITDIVQGLGNALAAKKYSKEAFDMAITFVKTQYLGQPAAVDPITQAILDKLNQPK